MLTTPEDYHRGLMEHDGLDEVSHSTVVEDEAEVLKTEAMDADQEGHAEVEQDDHERELEEIAKKSIADELGADSFVGDEDAREANADVQSPSGENNVVPARERRRSKSSEDQAPSSLPITRVKRIIKLDPDIRLVSKEGIFAVIQATQQFLEALAAESVSQAWKNKRKGVKADDILAAARSPKFRDCLGTTLSDFVQHLRGDSDDEDEGSEDELDREDIAAVSKKGSKKEVKRKCLQPPPGNRSITDFMKAAG